MFILLWTTLLFSVRRHHAYGGASPEKTKEITAEAGLCAVIPCYLSDDSGFTLGSAVWYKCEQNCTDSDAILRLNNSSPETRPGFRGRVSLLERDLSRRNCSIVINDLRKSDSGSYQLIPLNGTTNICRATLTVKDLSQRPSLKIPPLTEGQQTTLTCTAPGLCSGSAPKFTWTWEGSGKNDTPITGNTSNTRYSSKLTFNSSATHHGGRITCQVSFTNETTTAETQTLNVTYVKKLEITGERDVSTGDTLNLACSVDSFPLSNVAWTKNGSTKHLANDTRSATLVISSVKPEQSGLYICTAKHLKKILKEEVKVTVNPRPKILQSSSCKNDLKVLTCMCISKGDPLPFIKWPLLENHTHFTVITTKLNHTVNSTFILPVKNQNGNGTDCVSRNKYGEVKKTLFIMKATQEDEELYKRLIRAVTRLEIVIAFLIGALLSAITCCLVRKCHRRKTKIYGNFAEDLEMVTSQEDPLIEVGQAVENHHAIDHEAPEGGGEGEAAGKADVDYSNLDFSRIKRRSSEEAGAPQESTDTDYAEIKRGDAKVRQGEEGKEEEEMTGERMKECVIDDGEGEDVALYSNIKDILAQSEENIA
ncbi:sialic acid-binding Ig-like lectin 5 [Cheilinus undulatus]|uniref:sialic acid-binding Ig-like lectin 5 n=1 Tax=Cheilinus undulatus TaxID=241271 RepID=UPI001BD51F0F|nr:sialic acid-binding Ig-like lectin 5 [Cheilinus undulatus]